MFAWKTVLRRIAVRPSARLSVLHQRLASTAVPPTSNATTTGNNTAAGPHATIIDYPQLPWTNLVDMQVHQCKTLSDKPLFGTKTANAFQWLSYGDFGKQVANFRAVLSSFGLSPDDKVALISNNRSEWAVTCYAANSLRCQIVPMYEAQAEQDRRYIVQDSNAKVIVVATEALYAQTKDYVGKIGKVVSVLCFDADESKPYSYKRVMKEAAAMKPVDPNVPKPDEICSIIYTSGTSGNPKGVELSHHNILSNIAGLNERWEAQIKKTVEREVLCFLPWSHIFGQTVELHGVLGLGERMAIAPSRDELLSSCEILRPTQMAGVPILMNKIYDGVQKRIAEENPRRQKIVKWAFSVARQRNHLLEFGKPVPAFLEWKFKMIDKIIISKIRSKIIGGRLSFLGSGAAAVPMNVLQFFEDISIPICEGYGLTETSPTISSSTPGWSARRLGCVGMPIKGVSVKIRNVDKEEEEFLPADTDGEICVAGHNVMRGYRNNPAANNEVFFISKSDGLKYFRTGDMGRMVEGKFLKITGRIKEQYKLENGKYVSPSPLEDILCRSQFIHQTLLYGDNKMFNIVLIVPEVYELRHWAIKANLGVTTTTPIDELLAIPEIRKLISMEILVTSSTFKEYEKPQKWATVPEFTLENNQLTPKMSLRRRNILIAHMKVIENVYSGKIGYDVNEGGISTRKWYTTIDSSL